MPYERQRGRSKTKRLEEIPGRNTSGKRRQLRRLPLQKRTKPSSYQRLQPIIEPVRDGQAFQDAWYCWHEGDVLSELKYFLSLSMTFMLQKC